MSHPLLESIATAKCAIQVYILLLRPFYLLRISHNIYGTLDVYIRSHHVYR